MSDKRFNASLNCAHRITLVNLMGRVPVGGGAVTISPQEDFDLRNLAGAIDQAARAPGGCDAAIDMQTAIAFGDFSRKEFMASTSVVVVFPFLMPATGTTHIALSEYNGQPWERLLTVSATAGDLAAPLRSAGKVPDIYISPGAFPAGTQLYANMILTQEPTVPNSSGSGFSIVWPPA